jgi:hypothetical protein
MTDLDLDRLREKFPDWDITASWTTAASGPDQRHLIASNSDITISAWTAAELAREIERQEAGG